MNRSDREGKKCKALWAVQRTGYALRYIKTTFTFFKQQLQDNIDKLIMWSEKWHTLFKSEKYKCLHTGHGNTGVNYEMGGTTPCKKVITMNANMKDSEQCRIVASHGNQILGMIRRIITCKVNGLIIPLNKAVTQKNRQLSDVNSRQANGFLVRSHIIWDVAVWQSC